MDQNTSDQITLGYLAVCIGLLAGLIVVYKRTRGRSGPISALAFVVFGPVLGVVLIFIEAMRDAARTEVVRNSRISAGVDDFSIVTYVGMMAAIGLGASLIASILYMYSIRDELDEW